MTIQALCNPAARSARMGILQIMIALWAAAVVVPTLHFGCDCGAAIAPTDIAAEAKFESSSNLQDDANNTEYPYKEFSTSLFRTASFAGYGLGFQSNGVSVWWPSNAPDGDGFGNAQLFDWTQILLVFLMTQAISVHLAARRALVGFRGVPITSAMGWISAGQRGSDLLEHAVAGLEQQASRLQPRDQLALWKYRFHYIAVIGAQVLISLMLPLFSVWDKIQDDD
jgi:hypothetical protein